MGDPSSGVWGEDGQTYCAFEKIEGHCRKAGDGAEEHANKDNGEVLECERNRREGKWKRDVSAGSDEGGGPDNKEGLSSEEVLKRSSAMGKAELRGDCGLHRGDPFLLGVREKEKVRRTRVLIINGCEEMLGEVGL